PRKIAERYNCAIAAALGTGLNKRRRRNACGADFNRDEPPENRVTRTPLQRAAACRRRYRIELGALGGLREALAQPDGAVQREGVVRLGPRGADDRLAA